MGDSELDEIRDELWKQICEFEVLEQNQFLIRERTRMDMLGSGITNLKHLHDRLKDELESEDE